MALRRALYDHVRVFGSVARGEDTGGSDVDLLVDLADDVSLVGLIGLEREVSQIVHRRVDVVPARSLNRSVADHVLAEADQL